jgi:signal transduction histidine kinase
VTWVRGRHPYTWGKDHPLVVDGLMAVVLAALGVATEVAAPPEDVRRAADDLSGLLTLAATLPLVLRRRYPLAVFAVVVVASTVYFSREYPGAGTLMGWLVALYGVAAYERRRTAVICLVGTLAVIELGTLTSSDYGGVAELIGVGAVIVTAWVLGDNMRVRRAYVAAVEDRAAQLEREQDAQARRAVLEERSSIARELHDVVAHSMSVMVVQAGAARRTLNREPARATEAIGHIESTGRAALAEMRRLVGVLRSDVEPASSADDPGRGDEAASPASRPGEQPSLLPQPGIDQVPALVSQCREAGLDVSLQIEGNERPLPSGVELVAYRIVQEALTNTMRHAGPARAEVALCYGDTAVTVTVTDDGRGAASNGFVVVERNNLAVVTSRGEPGGPAAAPPAGPGHGLTGMRERVALYRGRIEVGPRPGGGFRVWAEIPVDEPNGAKQVAGEDAS